MDLVPLLCTRLWLLPSHDQTCLKAGGYGQTWSTLVNPGQTASAAHLDDHLCQLHCALVQLLILIVSPAPAAAGVMCSRAASSITLVSDDTHNHQHASSMGLVILRGCLNSDSQRISRRMHSITHGPPDSCTLHNSRSR